MSPCGVGKARSAFRALRARDTTTHGTAAATCLHAALGRRGAHPNERLGGARPLQNGALSILKDNFGHAGNAFYKAAPPAAGGWARTCIDGRHTSTEGTKGHTPSW